MGAGKTFIMPHVSAMRNMKKQYIAFYKKQDILLTLENIS